MKPSSMRTACFALSAFAAIPAWADTAAFAQLSGMHFELIDLRPKDGVAASIKFIGDQGSLTSIFLRNASGAPVYSATSQGSSPFSASFIAHAFGDVGARARVQADGSRDGTRLTARSFANAVRAEGSFAEARAELSERGSPLRFELSAHTKLALTADTRVSASTSQTRWPEPSENGYTVDRAVGWAGMTIGLESADGSIDRADGFNVGRAYQYDYVQTRPYGDIGEAQSYTSTEHNTLVFRKRTDDTINGGLTAFADVSSATAAVPEPETYAMFLSGMAIVGWVTRRKRASARG
jgi:PEP-CTERM motif